MLLVIFFSSLAELILPPAMIICVDSDHDHVLNYSTKLPFTPDYQVFTFKPRYPEDDCESRAGNDPAEKGIFNQYCSRPR